MQPAVRIDHGVGGFRLLPVTQHYRGATGKEFVVFSPFDFNAGQGGTNAGGFIVIQPVDGNHRTGFGEAITLKDIDTKRDKGPTDLGRQRRPATDGEPHVAAELGTDF